MSDFPLNLDPATIPQKPIAEPSKIRSGDTVTWSRSFDQFPPSQGYSLSYVFVSKSALYAVAGSMVTAGQDNYTIEIPAATTAGWAAGTYRWQAYITSADSKRYTVGEGVAEVLPNLQVATAGLDDREPDEIILDNIIAMLQGKATADVKEYEVAGRRLIRYSWSELMEMRSTYERRVRAIRIRRGEVLPTRTVGVTFNNGY